MGVSQKGKIPLRLRAHIQNFKKTDIYAHKKLYRREKKYEISVGKGIKLFNRFILSLLLKRIAIFYYPFYKTE